MTSLHEDSSNPYLHPPLFFFTHITLYFHFHSYVGLFTSSYTYIEWKQNLTLPCLCVFYVYPCLCLHIHCNGKTFFHRVYCRISELHQACLSGDKVKKNSSSFQHLKIPSFLPTLSRVSNKSTSVRLYLGK